MALRPPAPEADCTIKQRDIGTRLTRQVGETGKEHRTLLERRIDERHELAHVGRRLDLRPLDWRFDTSALQANLLRYISLKYGLVVKTWSTCRKSIRSS